VLVNGSIVVGVDGSDASVAALRWARREAVLRGSVVRALHCWTYPTAAGIPSMMLSDLPSIQRSSEAVLAEAIARATDDSIEPVSIETVLAEGSPGHALIEASDGADLLVVGVRGHGGFRGLLLGSVANQVVHHARCPVVVVPRPSTAP
jgi:nucleotide-binding universal stress UspA family protein